MLAHPILPSQLIHSSLQAVIDDCEMLVGLSEAVLADFAQLAVNNVRKGAVNKKIYSRAAAAIGETDARVIAAITGLSHIFLESSKRNFEEQDFKSSIQDLGFSEAQKQMLAEYYLSRRQEVRNCLTDLQTRLPHYHNLDWRLDVQIATRCLRQQAAPSFMMQLTTQSHSPTVGSSQGAGGAGGGDAATAAAPTTSIVTATQVTELQSDFKNLQNMCVEVRKALKAAQTPHSTRILRYVK
jgi:hypothetical protein